MDEQIETIRENAEHAGDIHVIISSLEKATGPDRSIDAAIQRATDGNILHIGCGGLTNAFTASIDAALMLVPSNGRLLELGQWQDSGRPDGWFAQVTMWVKDGQHGWIDQGFSYGVPEYGALKKPPLASNGAIALCIAALKARAALIAEERAK